MAGRVRRIVEGMIPIAAVAFVAGVALTPTAKFSGAGWETLRLIAEGGDEKPAAQGKG